MTWSAAELAKALNLTTMRISQMVKMRILPKPRDGQHDPFTAVPAYIEFLSKRLSGGNLTDARVAKYQIDTALQQLEYQERQGELVSRDAVEKEFFALGRQVRDTLLNVPARLAGLCAAERSQEKVYAIIEKELLQCLEAVSSGKSNGNARPAPAPRKKGPRPDESDNAAM